MRSLTDLLHLGGDVENIECLGGLAVVGEVADVLERVVLPFTAVLLVGAHQETKAVKLGDLESLFGVLTFKYRVEDFVDLHSVGNFLLELEASLVALLSNKLVVEVVKLNITRVNKVSGLGEIVLFDLGFSLVKSRLEEIVTVVALEAADVLTQEALVTELLDWGSRSLLSDGSSLLGKSFTKHV